MATYLMMMGVFAFDCRRAIVPRLYALGLTIGATSSPAAISARWRWRRAVTLPRGAMADTPIARPMLVVRLSHD